MVLDSGVRSCHCLGLLGRRARVVDAFVEYWAIAVAMRRQCVVWTATESAPRILLAARSYDDPMFRSSLVFDHYKYFPSISNETKKLFLHMVRDEGGGWTYIFEGIVNILCTARESMGSLLVEYIARGSHLFVDGRTARRPSQPCAIFV